MATTDDKEFEADYEQLRAEVAVKQPAVRALLDLPYVRQWINWGWLRGKRRQLASESGDSDALPPPASHT